MSASACRPAELRADLHLRQPERDDRGSPLVIETATAERRVKAYRVTLRPADRVRYVTLRTLGEASLPTRMTVKVR